MALPCVTCGGDTAGDGWCPRCLTAPAAGRSAGTTGTAVTAVTTLPTRPTAARRAGKSEISFGPVGRTVWTLGILAVPTPFLAISGGYAGWGFALLWWGVITPWSMRDLWRRR